MKALNSHLSAAAFSYEDIALTDLLSTFELSRNVATNLLKFDFIPAFTDFIHNHAILYKDTAGH